MRRNGTPRGSSSEAVAPTRGLKQRSGSPDEEEETLAELEVGAVVDGTVMRITPYGAFLTLEGGKVGLVHISEIDRNYV
ncbi:MAG: S1 RNA-binding domain-containing protein, partial [Actinomycetota bacterium]